MSKWDSYARVHLSVLTSAQLEVYREVDAHASGHVVDVGCGGGRMGAMLSNNSRIQSYVGVDASPEMIRVARRLLDEIHIDTFSVVETPIEVFTSDNFDFGFSINSYYAWSNPVSVLAHIRSLLKPAAPFLLATPNPRLDMPLLLAQADRELLGHPDYRTFRNLNLELASTYPGNFVEMHELVHQTQEAGFLLESCHTAFFLGGLNFVYLRNPG